ncbi:MAG: TonB-dependent receptor plug domain-containing protein, partial [bacterium]
EAEVISLDSKYDAIRTGGYVESELQVFRGVFTKIGLRTDHHNLSAQITLDPRASLYYQISGSSNLRVSWGIYHQFPVPLLYAPAYGNPDLKSQRSVHYILGYEHQLHDSHFRVEFYYKDYDNLVIENEVLEYMNKGYGYARGFDLFFKHGVLFQNKFNGWLSYSFLQSKRLQTRETKTGVVEEYAVSPFDITHNRTLVAKFSVTNRFSVGFTYRFATGRPFTPVVEAQKHPEFDFYIPFEGAVNSERLPNFQRLDSSLSYLLPLKQNNFAVFYLALSNVLNRQNVLGIDYSFDYSQRTPRTTNFSRFVYFGVTVNLH